MNMATLQERIKEEIVLRRGQVKERQWRQTGLTDEAARAGISAEEFRRLVNEVSRQINFEKLADLRRRLEDALDWNVGPGSLQYQLHQTQEDDFVAEGERMGLSASFMEDHWIPQLIADLKKENSHNPAAEEPNETVTPPPPVAPAPPVSNAPTSSPAVPQEFPGIPAPPPLHERVKAILDEYQGHITARDLRLLFRAMHTDERVLAEEILAYFSANFYASETEPLGATLREKLLSTDWRHLSWWDKAPVAEPVSTPEPAQAYVPPAPEPAPAYVPPVSEPVQRLAQPVAPPRSNAGLWGAVFAVVVLLILYLLIKPNQKKSGQDREEDGTDRTEKTTDSKPSNRKRTTDQSNNRADRDEGVVRNSTDSPSDENVATDNKKLNDRRANSTTEPVPSETKPPIEDSVKPLRKYDRLLETTGQFGEQPAKLGRKWGLWRDNEWMIYPIYDDITTFRDGRATVVRNGKTYDIDEKGNTVEE